MQTNNKKAQVLTPDFLMGLVIFTAVLFIGVSIWNISYEKSTWLYENKQMQKKALYISNILINTPGIPENWNTSNVIMAGLKKSNEDSLDPEKLINFRLLEYSHSKTVLGLGSYDYYINTTDTNDMPLKIGGAVTGASAVFARDTNDNIIKQLLQDYYGEWDYYWAGPGSPPNNANTVYYKSDASPPTEHHLFKMMMANMSSYDTIIIEAENTFNPDATDKAVLKTFVNEGGTLIDIKDKGGADIINHFPNVPIGTNSDASDRIGTIIEKDILLPGKEIGETITFESQAFRFNISEVDKAIAESDGHAGYCIICLWYYGSGKIYYLPDGNDNSGNPIEGMDIDGIELTFGNNDTADADNVVPIRRLITVMDGQTPKIGVMNLYIYK